jgi:Zn-dependent protease/CBS domain-containing protein
MTHHDTARPGRSGAGGKPGGTFEAGSLFGFRIRVHWSWLIAFFFVAWSLQGGYLPEVYPEWTSGQRWSVAALTSLLFFGSVLAHELAHSILARRRGHAVRDITLFIWGGASALEHEPRSARDEFWIALVGPLTSFATAALFLGVWAGAGALDLTAVYPIAGYLALINISLGLFNLLPGFPLDGGRVLRAAVWGRTGDMLRATRVASISGRVCALALVGLGLVSVTFGGGLSGLWLVFIGWYLWGSASLAYQQLVLTSALQGVPVGTLVDRDVPRVAPDMSLAELMYGRVLPTGRRVYFVSPVEDGDVLGIVTAADAERVPQAAWTTMSVYRAMTPRDRMLVAPPSAEALAVLQLMAQYHIQQVPVATGREMLGVVTLSSLMERLRPNRPAYSSSTGRA